MERFGRYWLKKEVGTGGMAKVYKAYLAGEGGFIKEVALKRLLPQFSADRSFVAMFTDEARLAVELSHPNIVQVYDFGRVGMEYFIAMEYVSGITFKDLIITSRSKDPLGRPKEEAVVFIVSEICKALQYAHSKTDPHGRILNIVHRDVTPHNILISYDGSVKLSDFGIAKASTNISHTETGFLKGKIAYMSPEQARGEALDGRSDIFSLGLVLFEGLTDKPLFEGRDSMVILRNLQRGEIQLDHVLKELPEKYRSVLRKALAPVADERYKDALEMYNDLTNILHELDPLYSSFKLSELLKALYREEIEEEEREEGEREGEIDLQTDISAERFNDETSYLGGDRDLSRVPSIKTKALRVLKWHAIPIISAIALISLVNDIIRPVIFILPALVGISLLGMMITIVANRKRLPRNGKLLALLELRSGAYFIFFFVASITWGLISIIYTRLPERGLMAGHIEAVKDIQDALLKSIKSDVSEIKGGISEIQEELKGIRKSIEELGGSNALIKDPKKPAELYHNAKLYALWGETGKAIDTYQRFLEKMPQFLDVNESFLALIKNTGGIEAARRIYGDLKRRFPNDPTIEMFYLKTEGLGSEELKERLSELSKRWPKYAPAYIEIVDAILSKGWTNLTSSEKMEFADIIKEFRKLDSDGYFNGYFLDKGALEAKYNTISQIETTYLPLARLVEDPVDINFEQYKSGVSIGFTIKDSGYSEIRYAIDNNSTQWMSTGTSPYLRDPLTNKPMPNLSISAKLAVGKHTVYVKYLDKNGRWSDVYTKEIQVTPFIVTYAPAGAIDISSDIRSIIVSFAVYKEGGVQIKGFRYSIDDNSLSNTLNLSAGEDGVDSTIKLKAGKHSLYAKAIYADGKESELVTLPLEL